MSFSPLISSVRFKWQLMSQFIYYRRLIFIAAGTKALFRCQGGNLFCIFWGVFFVLFWGGGQGYLLFKRQSWNNTTHLSEGWLLAPCGRTVSPCLPFPFFLLRPPHQLLSSPPHQPLSLLIFYFNHFLCPSHLVCAAACLSLKADSLSWFLIQQSGSNRQKRKRGTYEDAHTVLQTFSLCYRERHEQTAFIHLNAGYFSYCWCP